MDIIQKLKELQKAGNLTDEQKRVLKCSVAKHKASKKIQKKLNKKLEQSMQDTCRLNFLDWLNENLNNRHGTEYKWEMVINDNVNRLYAKNIHSIDLSDSCAIGVKSCRDAIDKNIDKSIFKC